MSPRDRDPAVWAAAYGAAFHDEYRTLVRTQEDNTPARIASMASEYAENVADLAVRALHPEGAEPRANAPTPGDVQRWRTVAELVIAEYAAASTGAKCERFGCNDTPAVCKVDGVAFCAKHAPRQSDYGLAVAVLALLARDTPTPSTDLATPAGRLAALQAAERAVLLAAGWIYHPNGADGSEGCGFWPEGVWEDVRECKPRGRWDHAPAVREQRSRDADDAHRP